MTTFNYYFSPSRVSFFAASLKPAYDAAGSWPSDATGIDDATYLTYSGNPPSGQRIGASGSSPVWVDMPAAPAPTLQEQAAAMMFGTVSVTSNSNSALNGTYSLAFPVQPQITGIAAAIAAGLGLPSGGSSFNWPDASGVAHSWDAASFTEFAKLVMQFVYTCAQVAQGHGSDLPSTSLTIA